MYVGVDIGGSKILVASSEDGHKLSGSLKIETPSSAQRGLAAIATAIEHLKGGQRLQGIGVAAPGPLDFQRGVMLTPVNLGWRTTPLRQFLSERFKVPVQVENDADAAALAEATLGAGRAHRYVLYVTISTGIGTGLIVDGQIYHGAYDTEGGHIVIDPDGPVCGCGGRGHFEAIVSGPAIKRRFGQFAYQITDPTIWEEIAADMARGLVTLINAYSPDVVVLGGGVSVHFAKFEQPLLHYLEQNRPIYPLPVVAPARFLETAPVMGALLLARQAANKVRP